MPNWRPSANLSAAKRRAQLYRSIRAYFTKNEVLEVSTPILGQSTATDPHLDSFEVDLGAEAAQTAYLQTSPEFPMKRLLASGFPSIYQISSVFRRGESGKRHNPEFTMLEWYRLSFDLLDLINDVLALLKSVGLHFEGYRIASYREVFQQHLALDPHADSIEMLRDAASTRGFAQAHNASRDDLLDFLMSHSIEPQLGSSGEPTFVTDYPATQASLAEHRLDDQGYTVAARFELYLDGIEIANGYRELLDPKVLAHRFQEDNLAREHLGKSQIPVDDYLLSAMESGMPYCSGVALGLDRLLMVLTDAKHIDEVILFPSARA